MGSVSGRSRRPEYETRHYLSYRGRILLAMPRQARLDTPNTLQHVMVRGLDPRSLFRDDTDRADDGARLAALAGRAIVLSCPMAPPRAVRHARRPQSTRTAPRPDRRTDTAPRSLPGTEAQEIPG